MSTSIRWVTLAAVIALAAALGHTKEKKSAASAWKPFTLANVTAKILPEAYYDPGRLDHQACFRSALAKLENSIPEVLVRGPDAKGIYQLQVGKKRRAISSADLKKWMAMLDRLLDVLQFVDQALGDPSRRNRLQYALIKGCVATLDPHTIFFTPDEYRRESSRFTGSLVGIGVFLVQQGKRIVIRDVVPGGPAAQAGVKAGDELLQVGALSMANLNPSIVASKLQGKEGTEVRITVRRRGGKRRFTMKRRAVALPSVKARMLPGRVALIEVTGFPKNVLEPFERALKKLGKKRPRAWVLDLRGNEGGYIEKAARMADHLLKAGLLVKAKGRGGQQVLTWVVKPKPDRLTRPLLVLVNRRTASAAEILAGSLALAGRALLIGQRTYGKGTVQKKFHLPDGSVLKMTQWQYLLRGTVPVQTTAIVPDIEMVPVRLAKGSLRFLTAGRGQREASQARHVKASVSPAAVAAWKGRPVLPPIRYAPRGEEDDPVLELALQIARATRQAKRAKLLKVATEVTRRFNLQQQEVNQKRLKTLGVDWSARPAGSPKTTLTVKLAPPAGKVLQAGQTVSLGVTVQNTGKEPAFRVGVVLSSFHRMLNRREVLLGKIPAGRSRQAALKITVPAGLRQRWERVRATVSSPSIAKPAQARALLRVDELPRPRFQASYLVDDRQTGNGDGLLGPGETADLLVFVKNIGQGTATVARVDATGAVGGLAVVQARASLGKLGPGATARGRLKVKLAPGKPRGDSPPGLTVTIYDKILNAELSFRIRLPRKVSKDPFRPRTGVGAPKSDKVKLTAWAGPDAPKVASVKKSARLAIEAARGPWLRVALPRGRFAFVAGADVQAQAGKAAEAGVTPHWSVIPAAIQVKPFKGVASRSLQTVQGTARSLAGLQDVWVRVWNPEAPSKAVDKVAYQAAPAGGATQLAWKAEVPLQHGTNYVVVDARNVSGVRSQHRLALFLPRSVAPHKPTASLAPAKGKGRAGKKKGKKKGCGCAQSGHAPPWGALVLGFGLFFLVRRRR